MTGKKHLPLRGTQARVVMAAAMLLSLPGWVLPAGAGGTGEGGAGPSEYSNWSNDTLLVSWDNLTVQPSMAPCPDGSVHVLWVDGRTGVPGIHYMKLDPTGHAVLVDRTLYEPVDPGDSLPKAVADRFGNLHVLWLGDQHRGNLPEGFGLSINHLFISAAGINYTERRVNWFFFNSTEYPVPVPDMWAFRNLSAALMPEGNLSLVFEVAWSGLINSLPPASYPTIGWMKLSPNGTKLDERGLNQVPRNLAGPGRQTNPSVTVDAADRVHAFWLDGGQPPITSLKWFLLNRTGTIAQGGMIIAVAGGSRPSSCTVQGPGGNVSVFYIDMLESALRMMSYNASDSPLGTAPRTVYRTDLNAPGEMEPTYLMQAGSDPDGNILVACEGTPAGDAGPPETSYACIGVFVISPRAEVLLSTPTLVSEAFNASAGNPILPFIPALHPALAVTAQAQAFLSWQVRFAPSDPGRPMGLHLLRTRFDDLALQDLRVQFNGSVPIENETFRVTVELKNRGDRTAYDVNVGFETDDHPARAFDVTVPAGGLKIFTFNWTGTRGNHSLAARLDPRSNPDTVAENNLVTRWIHVFPHPDLSITPEDITFSNDDPQAGEEVTITARVHDAGELAVIADVSFFVDGAFLAFWEISVIPSSSTPASAHWRALGGDHTFRVEVYNTTPHEDDLSNNSASRVLSVREGPPVISPEICITFPTPNSVVRGLVAVEGTASTVYPEAVILVECRSDPLPWEAAGGDSYWTYVWNTSLVADGIHTLEARATANGASRTASVRVEVQNIIPPRLYFRAFSPPGNASIFEGERAFFRAEARAEPAPPGPIFYDWRLDGRTVAAGNELRNYTLQSDFAMAGLHHIELLAGADFASGRLTAYASWNLSVVNVNRPPVIVSLRPAEAQVRFRTGESPDFVVVAADPDADALTYRWELDGRPLSRTTGGTIRPGGVASGTHNLSVNVSDGEFSVHGSWTLKVTGTGAPTLRNDIGTCGALLAVGAVLFVCYFVVQRSRARRRQPL